MAFFVGHTGHPALPVGLPAGVTLRTVDGGATYYADNGFTLAASTALTGMSWDDPRFFPVINDYSFYPSNSVTTFKAMGLNGAIRCTSDTNMATVLNANGIWAMLDGLNTNFGSETVAWHIEEPSDWTGGQDVTGQADTFASYLTGRALQVSFTAGNIIGDNVSGCPCGATMADAMGCTSSMPSGRYLNLANADIYWMAASGTGGTKQDAQTFNGASIYGQSGYATYDEMARGSNYGDLVDIFRTWGTSPGHPFPIIGPYVETEDGLLGDTGTRRILPQEYNWAVWSTIVHGARGLISFGTTSNFGSGSTFGYGTAVLSSPQAAWGSRSMSVQAAYTHNPIANIAPIINAPFALGYHTVSPSTWTFPSAHTVWDNGIDATTKYFTGSGFTNSLGTFGDGFYIVAAVRGSNTQTNISATFTLAGGYAGSVPAIRRVGAPDQASGTATVSAHQFTDTFTDAYSVHVYGPIPNV
jgi:hypothetical protein